MELLELIKEWAGLIVIVAGAIVAVIKIWPDQKKNNEQAKQEEQHTEQERLMTEEKELDLDSRRMKASEEVASLQHHHLAETREENLKLLEDNYEQRKAIVDLQFAVRELKREVSYIREEKGILCYFFCRKGKTCPDKEPVYGPFQLDAATIRELKQMINDE